MFWGWPCILDSQIGLIHQQHPLPLKFDTFIYRRIHKPRLPSSTFINALISYLLNARYDSPLLVVVPQFVMTPTPYLPAAVFPFHTTP